jgi:exodeoxyribonuclease VII large subunit
MHTDSITSTGMTVAKGVSLSAFLARVKGVINAGLPTPEWVRAEIRKIQVAGSGHVYVELEERNELGSTIAAAKGVIWNQRVGSIQSKFRAGTGDVLKTDIKVLICARADFHPVYGFDLVIEDIDPSYTLGDLIAKLRAIRAALKAETIFDRNKRLRPPPDFTRVAVISPETSAGLGDYRQETDRLQRAGLCAFDYYTATFQGSDASDSIRACIRRAHESHKYQAYDALVIIRGGGSVTDLAWLNDLQLALWVCRVPIPVFTVIGHERDSTILDEVANRKFDTPSKVALHISQTIRNNAIAARTDAERVVALVGRVLGRVRDALSVQRSRVEEQIGYVLGRADSDSRHFLENVSRSAVHAVRVARTMLVHSKTTTGAPSPHSRWHSPPHSECRSIRRAAPPLKRQRRPSPPD